MNLNLKATNTTLTPAVKAAVSNKLSALNKFLKSEDKLFVECEAEKTHKSGLIYRVEIKISPKNLYADSRGNDFYEALDLLIPKIKEQLLKAKGKRLAKRKVRKAIMLVN